ncbi:hypothetical protein GQR58_030448 [Nymphon striatum]|nr:hypothetical protein GQR58_030448 [Nymphon striatum]
MPDLALGNQLGQRFQNHRNIVFSLLAVFIFWCIAPLLTEAIATSVGPMHLIKVDVIRLLARVTTHFIFFSSMPLRHACADGDFIVCNRGRAARNFAQRQANADASPKATVPVLVLSNGNVIDESLDVMHWALSRNDPENWLNDDADPLIEHNDGPF